ncbi:hypothetical protein F4814DRAFT_58487 [Daldinia grandis]|nr:hypothetical protein F4814DRAFT_58487 [Daldinia grandis]
MGNLYDSSPSRGRSRHRTRRPTSVSGDDSPSPPKHKKRGHSHPVKQKVPIPRISIQAPTPPLSASSSAHHDILRNEQSRRIRHSQARETFRPANDGNKDTKDKDKGKGKSTSKDRGRDNSKGRTGRCTHVHHHHYHVHNHYHKYLYIDNDKQVGESTYDVSHSIYREPPFDQSDPQAAMKYQEEHHRKHVKQHQDREQQREQEQKKSQPTHHRRNSNSVSSSSGPSQQRSHQSTRSRSTAAQIAERREYPSRPPIVSYAGAYPAEPADDYIPKSFTSPDMRAYPQRTGTQRNVRNAMGQADAYNTTATALADADEEASAIVQANSPCSWTSSPSSSSSQGSVSTLATISHGPVYGRRGSGSGRGRRVSYGSESDLRSGQRQSKKGGFRAWVSRHLRD